MKIHKFKYILLIAALLTLTANSVRAESDIAHQKRQLQQIEKKWKNDKGSSANLQLETLEDYLSTGLARNPSLKASFYEWKSAVQKISKEFSLPDPQISYTDYSKESDKEKEYTVSQAIPWPEKLWFKRSMAVFGSDETHLKYLAKRLEVTRQIAEAYYEYAYLSKAVLITQENMKLLMNFESVAQSKYASGLTKNQDLLKIQVELGKLENELLSMEDMRRPLMARLIALLNLSSEVQLLWPSDDLENIDMSADYDDVAQLIIKMQSNNPELMSFKRNVKSGEQELKLAKRTYVPDFMVSVAQEKMRPTTMNTQDDPWMIMFSATVPLWFGRNNAEIQEARASLQAAEADRENKSNELESMLAMAHYKLRDALRQSRLYKDALIPKASQTLNAMKSAYESGGMDFLSLIDAQRMLLNFQLAYYRHNANFNQRIFEVQALVGEISSHDISKGEEQ